MVIKSKNKRIGKVVDWHHTISSARKDAKVRQMPVVQVEQPKGERPLYGFGKQNSKRYYVVTSAPKTLISSPKKGRCKCKRNTT